VTFAALDRVLWKPSRTYNREINSVGREYDAWTSEGILERYWGEHIHLGYYSPEDRSTGYRKKDFKKAKFDFVDEMLKFGDIGEIVKSGRPIRVLDCGCGIGGTSRHLARLLGPNAVVHGITLSTQQAVRARQLAVEQNTNNVQFEVMDALNMSFPENTFDIVWACESGEHMPDKKRYIVSLVNLVCVISSPRYIEEMVRVLKPGGKLIMATWCQRDETPDAPFTVEDRKMLNFLYSEWTHPYFISIADYHKIMQETGSLQDIATDDWTPQTISSWRHSIWAGVYDPMFVFRRYFN
jgi:MPBQ/MSBQ methyltransferase